MDHIFNQLDVSNKLSECTVVFGHSLSLSPAERQKVLHIMFEEKKVQSCWVVVNSSLALAVAGETSGLVIDIGSKKTILYPVYEMNVVSVLFVHYFPFHLLLLLFFFLA